MARNQQKQQHSLNKFIEHEKELDGENFLLPERRPRIAAEITKLEDCVKWRRQLLRETGKKISQIQQTDLSESIIRDLNDDINKLLRERVHWDAQVLKLGGPDLSEKQRNAEAESKELYTHSGYKYFGAAKDLPGVRELFEQQDHQEKTARKTRKELYRHILPDYYGWRDEDDGILLEAEKLAETSILQDELERMPDEYKEYVLNGGSGGMPAMGGDGSLLGGSLSAGGVLGSSAGRRGSSEMGGMGDSDGPGSKRPKMQAYVHTPSEDEIAKLLLERKKELLLKKMNKYITKEDQEKQDDMNAMIG